MTTWVSWYQNVKSFCILLQQENTEMAEVTIRTVNVQSSSQIITSNISTVFFRRPDALPVANQRCQCTEDKSEHSTAACAELPFHWCGLVSRWLGSRTCDQQVMSSNPNPGQLHYIHVPLSPSSITWFQPMDSDTQQLGGNSGPGRK